MHKVDARTYVGQPNETVTLKTVVADGGQIGVTLDGQPLPGNTQFPLPNAPGGHRILQIALVGPNGASCAVGIATVNVSGGMDADILVVHPHTPAPVHFYNFSVAGQQTVEAMTAFKASSATPSKGKKGGGKKGGGK